jgi:predicted nucleic acid-binding protein
LLLDESLPALASLVIPVPEGSYGGLEAAARRRLARRDESDWPYVALALRLNCPIWTEDQDYFGSGVATWTTDRIEIYLAAEL